MKAILHGKEMPAVQEAQPPKPQMTNDETLVLESSNTGGGTSERRRLPEVGKLPPVQENPALESPVQDGLPSSLWLLAILPLLLVVWYVGRRFMSSQKTRFSEPDLESGLREVQMDLHPLLQVRVD